MMMRIKTTWLGCVLALVSTSASAQITGEANIPATFVKGQAFTVSVTYTTGAEGGALAAWQVGPAAFELNGAPLADRSSTGEIPLPKGSSMTLSLDLSDAIAVDGDFELKLSDGGEATQVFAYEAAPEGLDFMELPVGDLASYNVLIRTNHGDMLVELYPDSAPNHVRNFLDLAYTGFYDGILFHRVSPTFMIQGGCPKTKTTLRSTWGTGNGPRTLKAEFNKRKHLRGILSAARGPSPNSASSQFFVMTAANAMLDNQYTVFGNLLLGFDTLDEIANAQGRANQDGTIAPRLPQRIEATFVLRHL